MEANPEYPNQKPEDFVDFYDAETSGIPWLTDENCSICGRVGAAFNPVFSHFPIMHCPYRNKGVHYQICSSLCMAKLVAIFKGESARYHSTKLHA